MHSWFIGSFKSGLGVNSQCILEKDTSTYYKKYNLNLKHHSFHALCMFNHSPALFFVGFSRSFMMNMSSARPWLLYCTDEATKAETAAVCSLCSVFSRRVNTQMVLNPFVFILWNLFASVSIHIHTFGLFLYTCCLCYPLRSRIGRR